MGFGVSPTKRKWKLLELPDNSQAMDSIAGVVSGDMLSNGTMEFFDAVDEEGGSLEIGAVIFREHDAAVVPALQKCPMKVYFFKKCAVATATGEPFVWTDELAQNYLGSVEIIAGDWIELGAADAFARVECALKLVLDEDIKIIQCIAVATATKTFTEDHTLKPELLVSE